MDETGVLNLLYLFNSKWNQLKYCFIHSNEDFLVYEPETQHWAFIGLVYKRFAYKIIILLL